MNFKTEIHKPTLEALHGVLRNLREQLTGLIGIEIAVPSMDMWKELAIAHFGSALIAERSGQPVTSAQFEGVPVVVDAQLGRDLIVVRHRVTVLDLDEIEGEVVLDADADADADVDAIPVMSGIVELLLHDDTNPRELNEVARRRFPEAVIMYVAEDGRCSMHNVEHAPPRNPADMRLPIGRFKFGAKLHRGYTGLLVEVTVIPSAAELHDLIEAAQTARGVVASLSAVAMSPDLAHQFQLLREALEEVRIERDKIRANCAALHSMAMEILGNATSLEQAREIARTMSSDETARVYFMELEELRRSGDKMETTVDPRYGDMMLSRRVTERGFLVFDEFVDTYNHSVRIQESSADGPAVWIFCEDAQAKDKTPHLSLEQARRVIAALEAFILERGE